jgi:fructoselysine-6-P-deglycase FrlB-like protein
LGSSRYAALVAAATARSRGMSAWTEHADLAGQGTAPADDLVLVAISASGRTPEVIATAERHRGRSLVVAVTNDPSSVLASLGDVVVPLHAGREASGIACRTFRAMIAALALLTGSAGVDDLREAVDGLARRVATPGDLDAAADDLDGASSIDVLAPPGLLGLAEQAALMLREAPRLPAHAWETGDWLHVAVYLALPGHRLVLVPGSPADDEVVATVERRGGSVHRLGAGDHAAGPIERTILGSLAAERLAASLWRRATANDKEP